jgi:hypothetical protein
MAVLQKPQGCEDSALRYRFKKKMRQLGCRTPWLYLDVPEVIIAKFGLPSRENLRRRITQRRRVR